MGVYDPNSPRPEDEADELTAEQQGVYRDGYDDESDEGWDGSADDDEELDDEEDE